MEKLTTEKLIAVAVMSAVLAVVWYFIGDWMNENAASLAFTTIFFITLASFFSLIWKD